MKKGWSEAALGDVLVPRVDTVSIQPERSYREITVAWWGKGVRLRRLVLGAEVAASDRNVAQTGDFIISKIDARHGAYGFVPPELDGGIVTNDFPVYQVKIERMTPRWLYWFTQRASFSRMCEAASEGSTRRVRVSGAKFDELRIPLPPLAEQQVLVAHLDAIESRLIRAQKLREEQEHELQAALRSAFHRLEAQAEWRPMYEVAPLAWRQITIDPEASYTEYGVRSFYKGIFLRRKVPGSAFSWQDLYSLQAGDLVFSNIMAWEKAIAVAGADQDGWVGNHRMLVCEPRRDVVLPSCLHHYFMTADGFAKILQASPGTAARNKTLKVDRLMEIRVPVPPMSQQLAFDALCQQFVQLRATRPPQAAEMNALLPSLLDRIFNI